MYLSAGDLERAFDRPEFRPAAAIVPTNTELLITAPANTSDHVLVRRVTRNLLAPVEPTPDEEVICRGVSGFNLRYYDGSEWQDTWDSASSVIPMPLAVEVMVQLDRPAGDAEPRKMKYLRVFPLACATTATAEEAQP